MSPPPPSFVRHVVPLGAYDQVTKSTAVGDVNGDGLPDIVVAGASFVAWYENRGGPNPSWVPHLIATTAPGAFSLVRGYGEGASVVVRDVNGDGRPDVITGEVAGADLTRTEVWFENTSSGWVRHVLSSVSYCHDLVFGDLNGDGKANEAMCDDEIHGQVSILRPTADPTTSWTTTLIDPIRNAMGSSIADIDRDGRLDVVAGRAWYRNPGGSGGWTRYPYTTMQPSVPHPEAGTFDDYERLAVLDLNGDGRLDIVASLFTDTPEGKLYAFLAPADSTSGSWTAVQIDAGPLFSVHSIAATADFDGSGRVQVLVAEMNVGGWDFGVNPHPHSYVYRLDGPAADPASWTRITVDNYGMHEANPPQMVDVNGDGPTDIVSGQENFNLYNPPRTGEVDWWENTTNSATVTAPPQNTGLPLISGTAEQGKTLSASSGDWTGSPTGFVDQWQRCDSDGSSCSDIPGAAANTYLLATADVGTTVRVRLTATNAGGSNTASSAPTAVIAAPTPVLVPPPVGGGSGPVGGGPSGGGDSNGGGGGGGGSSLPDLSVALSAEQAAAPAVGSELIYHVTVANKVGFGGSFNVTLRVDVPDGFTVTNTYSDRGNGCAGSISPLVCDLDWVSPLEDGHVTIWGTVGQAGPQVVTASVTAGPGEANPADNAATLTLQPASQVSPPSQSSDRQAARQLTSLRVTGAAKAGGVLHAEPPIWNVTPRKLTYHWQLCTAGRCHSIKDANTLALKLTRAEVGDSVRFVTTETIAGKATVIESRKIAIFK